MNFTKACVVIVTLFFVACLQFSSLVSADQDSAQSAISSAESSLKSAYDAVKQAESAGANVDSLATILNDAAMLLSKAELAYAGNDYDSAYTYASQSQNMLIDFIPQATALKDSAAKSIGTTVLPLILSLGVSIGLLCGGIAAWVVLGRRQRRLTHAASSL